MFLPRGPGAPGYNPCVLLSCCRSIETISSMLYLSLALILDEIYYTSYEFVLARSGILIVTTHSCLMFVVICKFYVVELVNKWEGEQIYAKVSLAC